MGIVDTGLSALGRLVALGLLVAAFGFGLVLVVYWSLQGSELKVPEITGKDFTESEKELAALGLKIKKRADRISAEAPNTVIEQLPKAGDTVKTGQMIMVVTSKGGGTTTADQTTPPTAKTGSDEDDSDKIEEMITDKPTQKKPKPNATPRKKADTARDTGSDTTDTTTTTTTSGGGDDPDMPKKEPGTKEPGGEKNGKEPAGGTTKPPVTKPPVTKPPTTTKPPTETHTKPPKP